MTPKTNFGYILQAFPQLSETFIENERHALASMGVPSRVYSIFRPAPERRGVTTVTPEEVRYLPGGAVLAAHFAGWVLRRPLTSAAGVVRALRARSKLMLRGAFWGGWLASQLRRDGIAHVHAHFATEPACAAIPAARLAGIPVTFTIHARDIYLRNRGLDLRVRAADGVVTVCEYNVEQILERFPTLRDVDFEMIYCGVDPVAFACAPQPAPASSVRLLSVGRLVAKKGFADLVDAVAILRAAGVAVTCEIVGDGELRADLEAHARAAGVADAVTLVGPLLPEQVADRIAACDVFVLACRVDDSGDRDSMPVVLKEAMARCRPVVATDTVGIPELVDDAVGVLVPPDAPQALAEGIRRLIDLGADGRAALGQAGRARVEEHFNLWTETAKLKALVERVG